MDKVKAYIESGVLEMYILDMLTDAERQEVESMAAAYSEVALEIAELREAIETYGKSHAVKPPATVKAFIMATADYSERLQNGEQPGDPPLLSENSTIEDYAPWLDREDISRPEDAEDIYAKIIGYTPSQLTAIVWAKIALPSEVHHDEYEKFLIVEGSCELIVGEVVHKLSAGDFLKIPLHVPHYISKITSNIPCKAILQRTAA